MLDVCCGRDGGIEVEKGILERGRQSDVLKTVETGDIDLRSSDLGKRIDLINGVDGGLYNTVSGGDILLKTGTDSTSNSLDGLVELEMASRVRTNRGWRTNGSYLLYSPNQNCQSSLDDEFQETKES